MQRRLDRGGCIAGSNLGHHLLALANHGGVPFGLQFADLGCAGPPRSSLSVFRSAVATWNSVSTLASPQPFAALSLVQLPRRCLNRRNATTRAMIVAITVNTNAI